MLQKLDLNATREEAHCLKGAAKTIGAASLAAVCFEVEKLSRQGDRDSVANAIARLEREFRAFSEIVESSPIAQAA